MVSVQVLLPVQAPDHPEKMEPLFAVALSLTLVPELNVALHVGLQLIPAGLLTTFPAPVPVIVTLN
jgi:hypothetical protein